jgi:hypothetical protein
MTSTDICRFSAIKRMTSRHSYSSPANYRKWQGLVGTHLSRAVGVPPVTVKRCCKNLRDEGTAGLFYPSVAPSGTKAHTDQWMAAAPVMLDQGYDVPTIGAALGALLTARLTHQTMPEKRK